MESNNHVRCQPAPQLLRRKKKQLALKDDWHRSWNEKSRDRKEGSVKEAKRQRHKPRLSSELGNSCIEKIMSPATSIVHSLPSLPTRIKDTEPLTGNTHILPMSHTGPLSPVSSGPPPDADDQDEDILLLLSDVPIGRSLTPRFQIESYDKNVRQPEAFGHSSLLNTQGPLERFLAQDEAYGNVDDHQNTNGAFLRLRALRANALRLRSILRTKRKLLRDKQSAKVEADEAFMRYVREHMFASDSSSIITKSDVLDELFNAMQESRNIYGPLQEDYDETEETLDDTEFEMGMIEGRIHKTTIVSNRETPRGKIHQETTSGASPLAPSSLMDFPSDFRLDYHPTHAKLLSRLGDLDIAAERLHSMRQEYEGLLSDEESRLNVGLELPGSLKSRLSELPEQQLALEEEITEIEKDVERLHLDCLAAGIDVDDDGEVYKAQDAEEHQRRDGDEICTANDDSDILQEFSSPSDTGTQSGKSTFPLLLPRTEDEEANLNSLTPTFDDSNKSEHINHWLLVELHASRLQVSLLHRITGEIFLQWKIDLDLQQWQLDVLQFWVRDETNRVEKGSDTRAQSSTAESHPSAALPGRPHAKSTGPSLNLLTVLPQLRSRKSAP